MRDPDLVVRAQGAATALESAWRHWREMHGLGVDPLPPVSSYVGYSLEAPWGDARVVLGICAEEAEQLTKLLEGHDCVGPVHASVTARPVGHAPAGADAGGDPGRDLRNGGDLGNGMGWPGAAKLVHVPAPAPASAGQQPLSAAAYSRLEPAVLRCSGLEQPARPLGSRRPPEQDPLTGPWRPELSEPGSSADSAAAGAPTPIALAASRAVEASAAARAPAINGSAAAADGQPDSGGTADDGDTGEADAPADVQAAGAADVVAGGPADAVAGAAGAVTAEGGPPPVSAVTPFPWVTSQLLAGQPPAIPPGRAPLARAPLASAPPGPAAGSAGVLPFRPRPEFSSSAVRRPGPGSSPEQAPPSASDDAATWGAGELPGQAAVSDSAV